jgi:hypothetical protein
MNFKLVECPKCKTKQILGSIYCETTCSCGLILTEDIEENRKEVRKENAEFAGCFNATFEEFEKALKQIEENWNEENAFVPFKIVGIPDEKLISLSEAKE